MKVITAIWPFLLVAAACSSATVNSQSPQTSQSSQTSQAARSTPRDGRELIQQMHDAYAGKWYRTLTFVQKTTMNRPGQPQRIQTWYESLLSPDRLRIDFGDLADNNGVIYTADSLYVVRAGKQVRAEADGNPFLPFVAGIYAQPVATSLAQINRYHFDLSALRTDTWQGRPVYVVGARNAADTTSAQFWVDRDRLVAVRMILALAPDPNAPPVDIRLDNYEPVGGGWLATRVSMLNKGAPMQLEEYSDWKGDVDLPAQFFDASNWTAVAHWAAKKP